MINELGHIVSLVPATRLGSYEITAKLGEGGIGQVLGAEPLSQ